MVVFSDLDGTLLDARMRSTPDAQQSLTLLAERRIPLVFCSSKTRVEIEALQEELGLRQPFVCENGGGVFVPDGYFAFDVPTARRVAGYQAVVFGRPYAEVVDRLHAIADRLSIPILGFSDMTVEEVAHDCQLTMLQARLAKLRDYDEPFRLINDDPAALVRIVRALQAAHLRCTDGGRYQHAGAEVDKGLGVQFLAALFRRVHPIITTVGLGEAPNDVPLLRHVDRPYIITSDAQTVDRLRMQLPSARVTTAAGAKGWAEAIVDIVGLDGVRQASR
jgi:mannosyl-3-phosphoglycerate phosphatase